MYFNPTAVIVSQNKLTYENCYDWKMNVDIVLIVEKYEFVLSDPWPPKPPSTPSKVAR